MYIMLNRISETVAYAILFAATAQQREYPNEHKHLIIY